MSVMLRGCVKSAGVGGWGGGGQELGAPPSRPPQRSLERASSSLNKPVDRDDGRQRAGGRGLRSLDPERGRGSVGELVEVRGLR